MEIIKSKPFEKAIRFYQKFWNIPNDEWLFVHVQENLFDESSLGKCPTG